MTSSNAPRGPSEAGSYIAGLEAAFDEAASRTATVQKTFRVAGRTIRMAFVGHTLVPGLTQALAHLACESDTAEDLLIKVFDGETSQAEVPRFPWSEPGGGFAANTVRPITYVHGDRFQLGHEPRTGFLSSIDHEKQVALVWAPNSDAIPDRESGAPLRTIFQWWSRHHDMQFAHAAAVGRADAGVLLVGSSGAGKSTTALSALHEGFDYVGDDHLLLERTEVPVAHSLYCSGKLFVTDLAKFPRFAPAVSHLSPTDRRKAVLLLDNDFAPSLVDQLPIRAVAVPCVVQRKRTEVHRISPVQCLSALAPSSLLQICGAGEHDLMRLARFIRGLPCYRIELGQDFGAVRRALSDLLTARPAAQN